MSKIDRPYSRVYWEVLDDPKFANVWDDDHCLAAWLRLLVAADMAWPASAALYNGVRRPALKVLCDAGLVDMQGKGRYRIHGLDKEREFRSEAGRAAINTRWHGRTEGLPTYTDADYAKVTGVVPTYPNGSTERLPSRDEPRRAEQRQDETTREVSKKNDQRRLVGGFTVEERELMAKTAAAAIQSKPEPKPRPERKPPEDEETITRCRAILADPEAPGWKRDAALDQLASMGASM